MLANANSYYIAASKTADKSTATLGWVIVDGGRDCPPPACKTAIVTGLPFADGDIDLTAWAGRRRFEARTLSYKFANAYDTYAELYAGIDELTAYLNDFLRSDLYDSTDGCTYHGVSRSADPPTVDITGLSAIVTVSFTAAPYKTNEAGNEVV